MLYLILLLPFLLGIGCAFCKEENARRLTPVLAAAQTVLTALVIYAAVSGKDWATNVVYLSESLTFSLKMDGVAAVFAVVTAVCWLLTIPYAAVYMPHSGGEPRFYVFLFTTEAVLLGTALAADMVTLYLFYELTTLCSAPLVLHELKKKAIIGAYKYLFYSVGGAFVALFGVVVVILMSPVWLQKHYGFAPAITLQANSIATIMLCIGCLLAGLAADRFGASRTFIVGSLLLAVASWAFYHLAGASPQRLFLLYGTVGLCVGVVGAVPYVMVRAFPAEVRFTGISFSYNLSYAIFGGLTPIAVTMLMGVSPMAPAWYVLALSLMGLGLGIWLRQELTAPTGMPEGELQR